MTYTLTPTAWPTLTAGAGSVSGSAAAGWTFNVPAAADRAYVVSEFLPYCDIEFDVTVPASTAGDYRVLHVAESWAAPAVVTSWGPWTFHVADSGTGTVTVRYRTSLVSQATLFTTTITPGVAYRVKVSRRLGSWGFTITQGATVGTGSIDPETVDQQFLFGPQFLAIGDPDGSISLPAGTAIKYVSSDIALTTPYATMRVAEVPAERMSLGSARRDAFASAALDGLRRDIRFPGGLVPHSVTIPGSPVYYNAAADGFAAFSWDIYWSGLLYREIGMLTTGRQQQLNFHALVQSDGRIPWVIKVNGTGDRFPGYSQPWYCAATYMLSQDGDTSWFNYDTLKGHLAWWETNRKSARGLFRWKEGRETGWDSNAAVVPTEDRADPPTVFDKWEAISGNAIMYREYEAMQALATAKGLTADAASYASKAAALKTAIQTHLWNPAASWFQSVNVTTAAFNPVYSADNIYALWAGVATLEQAQAIRDRIMDPAHFLRPGGITSLDLTDPRYQRTGFDIYTTNWNGPIWTTIQWIAAHGLARYGYAADALLVAQRCQAMVEVNAAQNIAGVGGTSHGRHGEWNDPETGLADVGSHNPFTGFHGLGDLLLTCVERDYDPAGVDAATLSNPSALRFTYGAGTSPTLRRLFRLGGGALKLPEPTP